MKTTQTIVKRLFQRAAILIVAIACFGLMSCSKDGGVGSGLKGYYTDLSKPAKASDFNELNTAINNGELLTSYHYGGQTHNHFAEYDMFVNDDGMYSDSDPSCGRLRWAIENSQITKTRVVPTHKKRFISCMRVLSSATWPTVTPQPIILM